MKGPKRKYLFPQVAGSITLLPPVTSQHKNEVNICYKRPDFSA
jgi:hypothetical protein